MPAGLPTTVLAYKFLIQNTPTPAQQQRLGDYRTVAVRLVSRVRSSITPFKVSGPCPYLPGYYLIFPNIICSRYRGPGGNLQPVRLQYVYTALPAVTVKYIRSVKYFHGTANCPSIRGFSANDDAATSGPQSVDRANGVSGPTENKIIQKRVSII